MPKHHTPGVHFEWQDRRFSGVSLARADVAAFIGIAARGPVGQPIRIESWNQFTSAFGGYTQSGYLAWAVEGFFANGGKRCWVVRVASREATAARWQFSTSQRMPALTLQAASPGSWATQLAISVVPLGSGLFTLSLALPDGTRETWRNLSIQKPFVDLAMNGKSNIVRISLEDPQLWQSPPLMAVEPVGPRAFRLSLDAGQMEVTLDDEHPANLVARISWGTPPISVRLQSADSLPLAKHLSSETLPPGTRRFVKTPRFAGGVLNDAASGSHLATIAQIADVPNPGEIPVLLGGTDGLSDLTYPDFVEALNNVAVIEEIAILCMPDIFGKPMQAFRSRERKYPCTVITCEQPRPAPTAVQEMPPPFNRDQIIWLQQSMVDQCTLLKDRIAILDSPSESEDPEAAKEWRSQFDSPYAACYYPWLLVPDRLQPEGLVRAVPPCGHIAGIFARVEHTTGVHKPPANEVVEGAEDVTATLEDLEHGLLNDEQVNVIRSYRGRRIRVAGARTVSSNSTWRFVNVRRLFIAIERSIRMNLQWIVFEPSSPALWLQIDRVVRSFLEGLWMHGFLDGETRDAAYSVICDASTNPPSETDNGRVTCEIGVLPPWPAEFIIVRIGITEGGVEMLAPAEAYVA